MTNFEKQYFEQDFLMPHNLADHVAMLTWYLEHCASFAFIMTITAMMKVMSIVNRKSEED